MDAKRYPLPKRFNVAMSVKAYENLRALNKKYGYGNNYLLTILLENIEEVTTQKEVEKVFTRFKTAYGAPSVGVMKNKT